MAFRSRNFYAIYLKAGILVFAGDAAQSEIIEVFNQKTTM